MAQASSSERDVLLAQAHKLAYVERLNQLRGVHQPKFDKRGLHPYSVIWGQIIALSGPDDDYATSPEKMRRLARAEAELAHYDEQVGQRKREDYVEAIERVSNDER